VLWHSPCLATNHTIQPAAAKNDKIDSEKIARLLRGGTFPMSCVYPRQMRSTRDLLRRRCFLVRRRGELLAHLNNTFSQYNVTLAADFDKQRTSVELDLKRNAKIHDPDSFHRLKTAKVRPTRRSATRT
jgi:hypothetical protein